MSPWMMAMISGKRRVVSETFTTSQTWVCPLGVSRLNTLTGKGQDGSGITTPNATTFLVNVNYQASGTGVDGSATWANFDASVNGWVSTLNSTGSVSYNRTVVSAYPDGTVTFNSQATQSISGAVPGTAVKITYGAWAASGAITATGDAAVNYNFYLAAAPGSDTTGFGYTFAGGAADTPATPVTHNNVAVVSGASYSLVVPAGGSITISYFR